MQLNALTIQIVVLANFVALFVAWSCVVRSYPTLSAAKFWQAATIIAAAAAAIAMLRGLIHPLFPIVVGNTLMMTACGLSWAGIRRFYGRSVPWRAIVAIVAAVALLLFGLTVFYDDIGARICAMSLGQILVFGLAVRELRRRPEPRRSPGAQLASIMIIVMMITDVARSLLALAGAGGPISPVTFNGPQAGALLILIFTSIMLNFGFVLMTIDRLRADVAALALVDDLTGIANRRHFLVRLAEACARAAHSHEPLALLVIDLDGFKSINDGYGHGAGDACLRAFTRAAQARLRDSDLFARSGGDEFCVILPSTSLDEAALVARDLVKTSRKARAQWNGEHIPMTVSIGVAAWSPEMGLDSQMLITAADQALYAAKKQGRDRLALQSPDELRMTA